MFMEVNIKWRRNDIVESYALSADLAVASSGESCIGSKLIDEKLHWVCET